MEWINIQERLPEFEKDVWVSTKEFVQFVAYFRSPTDNGWVWEPSIPEYGLDVATMHAFSHWMPLQKPPGY